MAKQDIGIIGLGVMGQNLALNFAQHGFAVAGTDVDANRRARVESLGSGLDIRVLPDAGALCAALTLPRKILLMVPAGSIVDTVIAQLRPHLQPGDVLIDGGNSDHLDTARRLGELHTDGILYVGAGISGGEQGALSGPSIMPGGAPAAWPLIQPLLQAIAARTPDGQPCCQWLGSGGAGHFVKVVHNGIEYADMQLIGESFALLASSGLHPQAAADVFDAWNAGPLHSYLIEITARILRQQDPESGQPLVHVILDAAGQKGTGKWASKTALDLGVPAPTFIEAVLARFLSALKPERVAAAAVLPGPARGFAGHDAAFVSDLGAALYAAKLCCYAQGFQLLRAANAEYAWNLDYAAIAQLWRAGCIIRAQFLEDVQAAYTAAPGLPNLLLAPCFGTVLQQSQDGWRRIVSDAVLAGVPVPALSSALAYYDGYRSAVLPANLLQAQRDLFGAHRYERTDKPRGQFFHTDWS